ncbi:MAG: VacJ family lipoprotein [Desulfuromonadales bacterium]|nr:VacJ family lipoprotein [Desulfuromonadales bacterium]MBN2793156.1 VacJ family lipoprotein [Desulfuromonadales bacterium]
MLKRMLILLLVAAFLCLGMQLFAAQQGPGDPVIVAKRTADLSPDEAFDADFGDDLGAAEVPKKLISDPLEPLNRGVFWVNDKLYFYLFKPIARGYRLVVPRQARVSVGNVFSNIATPIRAGNALLQLKFRDFGTELYRFVINTTFGIGGLFDLAESVAGVKPVIEDFGQTLGYYGSGHGFYLVLPVVGPSSLRDGAGSFVDSFADPFRYADLETLEYFGIKFWDAENRLSLDRDTYEGIVRDSIDPYLFIRAAYAQRRLAQVGQNTYNINLFQNPLFDTDLFDPFDWFGFE